MVLDDDAELLTGSVPAAMVTPRVAMAAVAAM